MASDRELTPEQCDALRARRRQRWRKWAAKKRRRALDAARRGRQTCPRRAGSGECGGILEHDALRDGTIVTRCPKCSRRERGICADCPRPVEGRVGSAMRCRECKKQMRCTYSERYRLRDPERYRQKWRRMVTKRRADPVRHARDLVVKKAWRDRNVVRIKMQKRKWRLNPNRPNGYSSREKYEDYHRRYRAKHAARRRELAKRRYYELHPDRPHPVCACGCNQPIPWDGRYRPRKWLPEHDPWPRALTPKETLMKAVLRATAVLERALEVVNKKLKGVEQLQAEKAAIERALGELRSAVDASTAIATSDITPRRRGGRPPKVANA